MVEANSTDNGNGRVKAALAEYQLEELKKSVDTLTAEFRAYAARASEQAQAIATTQATLCERVANHDDDIRALKGESRIVGVVNAFATAIVAAYFGITGGR